MFCVSFSLYACCHGGSDEILRNVQLNESVNCCFERLFDHSFGDGGFGNNRLNTVLITK
jgi:hypothetical protein